jgi:hypothetical protein
MKTVQANRKEPFQVTGQEGWVRQEKEGKMALLSGQKGGQNLGGCLTTLSG